MRVELVTVGDELLIGDTINGNAAWLGQALTRIGVTVARSVVVGDTLGEITSAITTALAAADAVILTGGLGPTYDDRTRDALAELAGVPLVRDAGIEKALRDRADRFGVPLRPMALRMADLPEGAVVLPNPAGSAPGMRMAHTGGVIYALPGVPYEMQAIMTETVLAELDTGSAPAVTTLRTAGLWESVIATRLAPVEATDGIAIAYLPDPGEVRIRITAVDTAALDKAVTHIRRLLGHTVYGTGSESLVGVVQALLEQRGQTVAVAESLTGGLLGAELSTLPGSSSTYLGGVTAYATPLKARLLGVSE
ncbi:MAG: molybdopterin-binding protein, partial [Streptosporangiaceae bacterium]